MSFFVPTSSTIEKDSLMRMHDDIPVDILLLFVVLKDIAHGKASFSRILKRTFMSNTMNIYQECSLDI